MKLTEAAAEALPLLVRARCFDAIQLAAAAEGGPVTSEFVRTRMRPPVAASSKGLTSLLRRIEAMGPDDTGRRLAGDVDRIGVVRWWVEAPDPRKARIAALAGELAEPGEDFSGVVLRALEWAAQMPAEAPTPAPGELAQVASAELEPHHAVPIPETEPDPTPYETAPPAEPPQEPPPVAVESPDRGSVAPAPPVPGPATLEDLFRLARPLTADAPGPLHLQSDPWK